MTDDNQLYELSRRKVLAGLGTVGAASAGAGLGTSALFSDTESFEGNTLTAGTLDLKVDWEEHYSYPQMYGFEDPATGLDITRSEPADTADYTPLPDPNNPMVWVHNDDLEAYMDNTAIDSYPDPDNDGVQNPFAQEEGGETNDGVGYVCADGADMDTDLDPSGLRTSNADTNAETGGHPLVNLEDVKPGDFGELTLSFHLCDNPGYLWLQGGLDSADENGLTEPEEGSAGEESGVVELLDEIQTAVWYDDGDNVLESRAQGESDPADVVIVFDESGSMDNTNEKWNSALDGARTLVNALGSDANVGLVSFDDEATLRQGLTNNTSDVQSAIDDIENAGAGGGTDINEAVDAGRSELTGSQTGAATITPSGNDRGNARRVMVFLTNGSPTSGGSESDILTSTDAAKNTEDTTIYGIAYGSGANEELVEDMSSPPKDDDGTIDDDDEHAYIGGQADIGQIFTNIGQAIGGGETIITRGSLRDTLNMLSSGNGVPLDATPGSEERVCFDNSTTGYIGMAWWLPTEVGNHVQSDSVSFDLGFYTEQCRNNDGSGPATPS